MTTPEFIACIVIIFAFAAIAGRYLDKQEGKQRARRNTEWRDRE